MKVAVVGVTGLVGTRMMEVLFITVAVMVQYLEVGMMFISHQIVTQIQIRLRVSQEHTMTRQGKVIAFSQAIQVAIISRYRRLKWSELAFKGYRNSQTVKIKLN